MCVNSLGVHPLFSALRKATIRELARVFCIKKLLEIQAAFGT